MSTFKRVLVGYDSSDHAEDAVALGKLIAQKTGAELVLASVVPNPVGGSFVSALPADAYTELNVKAKAALDTAAERAGAGSEIQQSSSPAHGLLTVAEQIEADLIVVGSSPRAEEGQTRAGRKARQLMSGGASGVAVAPAGFRNGGTLARIGVGIDGSPESKLALAVAGGLVPEGSSLQLIAVAAGFADEWGRWGATYPLAEMAEATREAAQDYLKEAAGSLPQGVKAEPLLLEGTAPIKLAEATTGIDLLCLGSRGYGPVKRVLLGSVSADVVNHASSAVMVLPRSE